MMRNVYAHTGDSQRTGYPSYISVNHERGSDDLHVTVRGAAHLVETENGSHFACGDTTETVLTKEQAMDLAQSITKHYQDTTAFGYPLKQSHEDGIGEEARRRFFPEDHLPGETSRVYEETERVGELQHTRRLVIESYDNEPLPSQTERLARFILENFEGEPSTNDGAIDVAIRLLGELAGYHKAKMTRDEIRRKIATDHIAEGLRKGQAKPHNLETANTTVAPDGFVNAGTKAEGVSYDDPRFTVEAAHEGGINEPAAQSLPLGAVVYPDERAYSAPRHDGAFDVVSPQPEPAPAHPQDDEIPF